MRCHVHISYVKSGVQFVEGLTGTETDAANRLDKLRSEKVPARMIFEGQLVGRVWNNEGTWTYSFDPWPWTQAVQQQRDI